MSRKIIYSLAVCAYLLQPGLCMEDRGAQHPDRLPNTPVREEKEIPLPSNPGRRTPTYVRLPMPAGMRESIEKAKKYPANQQDNPNARPPQH